MKVISKFILVVFLVLISFLTYLTLVGIETNKFNQQILNEIKKIDKNIKVDLKDIKLVLDPFKLKLFTKTIGTKIQNQNKTIEIENIKAQISLKSIISNQFLIEKIKISTKSIEINELIKFIRTLKRSPELFVLEKFIKKGYLIADIEIEFDSQGKIKDNYKINGFVKGAKFQSIKKFNIEKLNFDFNYKKEQITLLDLKFSFNKLDLFSKKIEINTIKDELLVSGQIDHTEFEFSNDDLEFFIKPFVSKLKVEKLKLSSKNIFSFMLNKRFKIKDLEIDSEILVNNLLITNNYDLKNFFPNVQKSISISNNKINIKYNKKNFKIKGEGNILFQDKNDYINYSFKKKDEVLEFETLLTIKNNPLVLSLLNFKKNIESETLIRLKGTKGKNKETLINLLSLEEDKNKIVLEDLLINKKNRIIDFNNFDLDLIDSENQRNSIQLIKDNKQYLLKGTFLNANRLIDILINNQKNNSSVIDINSKIKVKIDKVRLDKNHNLKNFTGILVLQNQNVEKAELIGNFLNDKELRFTINTKDNNKITTLYLDKAEPIVKRYDFIKGFNGGELDLYSSKKLNKSTTTLKIYNFKLKELPALTKILTLASLQGIADILTGEGIRFDELEMNFVNEGNLITINEMYAIGPAISILMDGYIEEGKLISLRGTLVPATTINKAIGNIPILGKILVGSKTGEGVFGVSFKVKGPPKKLETTVNPIKTLTPRFITRTLEKIKKN